MKRSATLGGLVAIIVGLSVATCGAAPSDEANPAPPTELPGPVPPTVIGMNLARPRAYESIWPFADLVQSNGNIFFARGEWISPEEEGAQLVDPAGIVHFDATGHPIGVPAGNTIGLTLQLGASPQYPLGVIRCTISPGWTVRPQRITMITHAPGHFDLEFPPGRPTGGGGALFLTPSGAKASLTTASCLLPGIPPNAMFNPEYVDQIRPFRIIRFMDWMRANSAPPATWAERTTPAHLSQIGSRGTSVEYMVGLANAAKADPWFSLPFHADDDYYRRFAEYVRDHLDPDRRAYVELSNEVWNNQFQQAKDSVAAGLAAGLDTNPRAAGDRYYADRVRALMAIWSQVFAGQEKRLVRVLGAQAVSAGSSDRMLSWKDTAHSVDALAIAPYFYLEGKIDPDIPQAELAARIFGAEGLQRVDAAIEAAAKQKVVANKYGVRLIAYEAGQHFAMPRNALSEKYGIINADQRMELLYRRYLEGWRKRIGDAILLYNDIGRPTRSGSFGHKEYMLQPLAQAPKMRAVLAEVAKDAKRTKQ